MPNPAIPIPAEMPHPAAASIADWAGSWKSAEITDPDIEDQKFTLVVEFEVVGEKLIGRVKDGPASFSIVDPKVAGNTVTFYYQSEISTSDPDKPKPYKQYFHGVRIGNTIKFRSWDDLGSTPIRFDARRTGAK